MSHVLKLLVLAILLLVSRVSAEPRWSKERAAEWYRKTGWLIGCNYSPRTAINQLEMWQKETWDPSTVDQELSWAESLGFNSVRVFLHDLLWEKDRSGFLRRMDEFLKIADRHKIGTMFVLFDSVWDPHPYWGRQREPTPHLHNSGWIQSPGAEILRDPERFEKLRGYVQGVIRRFARDRRIHAWDLWNEPDNINGNSYRPWEVPGKGDKVAVYLKKVFDWARQVNPNQPLTSGLWIGEWEDPTKMKAWERVQLDESDVLSYHSYGKIDEQARRVDSLAKHGRPVLCTEYMARPMGSTFEAILPYLKQQNVSAYNWGFVAGKTNTIYPWDSWQKRYEAEPPLWFHDIFRGDGRPYIESEVQFIRRLTGRQRTAIPDNLRRTPTPIRVRSRAW